MQFVVATPFHWHRASARCWLGAHAAAVSTAFFAFWEAVEAAEIVWSSYVTGLKPGANEKKTARMILKTQPEKFAQTKSTLDRILRPDTVLAMNQMGHKPIWPKLM